MNWDGFGHIPIGLAIGLAIVFAWDGMNWVGMKWVGLGWDELSWEMGWDELRWEMVWVGMG